MTRRNPPARYTLPEVIDPEETRCYTIRVPDEIYHVAAFKGAIFSLSKAYAWQNDLEHTALAVAEVWKNIFYALVEGGSCTMWRVEGCLFQQSDDGVTWTTLVDLSECTTPGATGPQGEQGEKGDTGDTGATGATGAQGIQGVQGVPGEDGATGAQGIQGIPGTAGIPGLPGEPGNDGRDGLDAANVPPPEETASDGLRCGVALNMAREMRALWANLYDADVKTALDKLLSGGTAASGLLALVFPGVALAVGAATAIVLVLKGLVDVIDAGEIENFDDAAEERIRCYVYCAIASDGDFTSASREEVVAEIRADTAFTGGYNDYIADFINVIPLDVLRWVAWTSSAISEEACLDCECEDLDCPEGSTWESVVDLRTSLPGCVTIDFGAWSSGGLFGVTPDAVNSKRAARFSIPVDTCTIKRMTGMYSAGGGSGPNENVTFNTQPGFLIYGTRDEVQSGTHISKIETIDRSSVTEIWFGINSGETDVQVVLERLIICGSGTKPSQLP